MILLGEPDAFVRAIESQTLERQTTLVERLVESDELLVKRAKEEENYLDEKSKKLKKLYIIK